MRTKIGLAALIVVCNVSLALAGPLDHLSGRWAGWGNLQTTAGASEKLKCVTTYKPRSAGTKAQQKFRCTSASYRFDAVVNYSAKSGKLAGDWLERIYSIGGPLSGTLKAGALNMTIRSETFVGRVRINSGRCTQTISIRPRGGVEIQSIRVNLKRC